MALPPLNARQAMGFATHLWKAATQQHHKEMTPVIGRWLPVDGVAFDIGAHAGQYTKLLARIASAGRVYAFEPAGYARAILERVVRLRGLRHVEVVATALADRVGEAEIVTPIKKSGSYGFGLAHLGEDMSGRRLYRERVPTVPLDRFAAERGMERLDFVKMDVEGWEVRILAGAEKTLERFRPAIMVEAVAAHLERAGDTPDGLWSILTPLGYRAEKIGREGGLAPVDGFAGDADYLFHAV